MDYVFVFNVSQEAVRSAFLPTACNVLIELLYGRDDTIPPYFPPSSRIAIIAFDRTLQFYNLSTDVDGQSPMLVVPDVDDVFLPANSGLFVNPAEHRDAITNLLASLPLRHEQSYETEAALGSVLVGRSRSAGRTGWPGRGIRRNATYNRRRLPSTFGG